MSRKKKKKAKGGGAPKGPTRAAVKAWRAWLADDGGEAPSGGDAQAPALQTFLTGDGAPPTSITGDLATALVEHLTDARDADRLTRCAEHGDKALAKAARRALHGLKRQGVEVPEVDTGPRHRMAPRTTADDEQSRCVMTTPFGDGDRVYVFRFRGTGDRRLHAGVATLSDDKGLRDLDLYLGNARLYQAMARQADERVPAANVAFEWMLTRLFAAVERTKAAGRLLPEHWSALRSLLKRPEAPPPHPAETLSPGEVPDAAGQFSLWQTPAIRAWSPPQEWLAALGGRFGEVLGSEVMVHDMLREQRLADALDEALDTLFEGDGRAQWAARLQDAAWVSHEKRADDVAAPLLALRDQLLSHERPATLPFWRQLVIRLFANRLEPQVAQRLAPGMPAPEVGAVAPPKTDDQPLLWTPDQGNDPTRGGGDGGGQGGAPEGGGGLIIPGR